MVSQKIDDDYDVAVTIPTLHPDQLRAFNVRNPDGTRPKRRAIRCGRRWGKTDLGKTVLGDAVCAGENIGWFAPEYKFIAEAFNEIHDMLAPIKKSSSKTDGVFRATTGGRVDYWTLENERAGRSRKYHKIFIDEAAFAKDNAFDVWERSIEPTLLDYDGEAWVMSNTNGISPTNFFWRICNEPEHGFIEYHAPSRNNPHVPARKPGESEIEHMRRAEAAYAKLKADKPPLVFLQEYEAEFVDWSGVAFFERQRLLVNGEGVPLPSVCDTIFITMDTAAKDGKENDGTAVCFWAYSPYATYPLVLLDWEYVQIQGSLLEEWLPQMIMRANNYVTTCGARLGFSGAHIEDKSTGIVLIQKAESHGLNAHAIDSKLTSLGKSGRAVSISEFVYQNKVKLSSIAHDKQVTYKERTLNHLLNQVIGFRVGSTEKSDDDLLDAFCYGVALSLGNSEGF